MLNRKILYGGLLAIGGVVILTAIYIFLDRPRTVEGAIARGDVRALEKMLQEERLETGPDSPHYLTYAINWRPSFYRRGRRATDKQIARRNQISYDMVKLLVEHGADINRIHDYANLSPLMSAINRNMTEVVEYLLDNRALVNVFAERQVSPLMIAVSVPSNIEIVKLLLDHNAKETINHTDHDGHTALHCAFNPRIVKLLLENTADPTIRNNAGQTPLEQAREHNWTGKVAVLEKYME